jgi:hypothetical protein
MFADLAQKLGNLNPYQQIRVTFWVDKPVGDMTSAAFKQGGKRVPYVRKGHYFHAYFCRNTCSCLQSFLQMVADQGLAISRYGIQYGWKKAVPMLVPDAEKAISPVLNRLGYVKCAGDEVHYTKTDGSRIDEVALTCFRGESYLHLHGPSSPETQAGEWEQLWECFTAPASGEETPRKRAAAESLCSLNPGQGEDSPAGRTRSKMPKFSKMN